MVWAVSKWWENHLPHHYLMLLGDLLHWFHMWDYDPPPYFHISVCMYLVLIPYIDDVLIIFMGMIGGRMEGLNVPFGREILHVNYATCVRDNIGKTMFVSFDLLSPCGMNYLHLIRNLEDQFMEGWIGEHLSYEGSLSHVGITNGGGEEL